MPVTAADFEDRTRPDGTVFVVALTDDARDLVRDFQLGIYQCNPIPIDDLYELIRNLVTDYWENRGEFNNDTDWMHAVATDIIDGRFITHGDRVAWLAAAPLDRMTLVDELLADDGLMQDEGLFDFIGSAIRYEIDLASNLVIERLTTSHPHRTIDL